jgi:(p)ppGpp synthase/HD superfamily hydrolase
VGIAGGIPNSMQGRPKTLVALDYARELHADQRRGDGTPFILHPREVVALLRDAGAPQHLIAAGALHDVIEKTPATAFDLRRRFGSTIASLVLAVTEDEHIPRYAERKAALRDQVAEAGEEALLLFAADKVSNVRELREAAAERRSRKRRLKHYRRCLTLLQERLPESPLVAQLDAELAAISDGRSGVLASTGIA